MPMRPRLSSDRTAAGGRPLGLGKPTPTPSVPVELQKLVQAEKIRDAVAVSALRRADRQAGAGPSRHGGLE